jgi:hypothetical protein
MLINKANFIKLSLSVLLLITFVCLRPWQNTAVNAASFTDNSATGFNTGTYSNSQYDSGRSGVDVVPSNKNATFTSAIKNAGANVNWNSLSWTQDQQYGAELPSSGGADSGYTNNLSMTNNQVYYKFNESGTSVSNWADSSGNGNNIVSNGGSAPDSTTSGLFNNAMTLSTSQTKYSILPAGVAAAGQSKYTVMFWMQPTTITNPGTNVLYEEPQGVVTFGPRLSIRLVNAQIQFIGRPTDLDLANTTFVSTTQIISTGNWYHIAAVYDSTSSTNNLRVYIDGVETDNSLSVSAFTNTINLLVKPRIGQATTGNTNKFNGNIDEFATFTRALSTAEIQQVYRRGAWNQSLLARSCTVADCSGSTLVGGSGTATPFSNDGTNGVNTVTLSQTFFPPSQYFQYQITFTARASGSVNFPASASSSLVSQVTINYTPNISTPSLSFAIRNSSDTANANNCILSQPSILAVSTCSYRLKISTNATNGYIVYIKTSGGLTNGLYTISNASAGSGGSGGDDISNTTAGIEKYGVVISPGSTTSGSSITLASIFNAGTNAVLYNYPSSATAIVQSTGANLPSATDTTNTILVTHKLNISSSTPPGNYTRTITYTVTGSF